MKKIKKYLKNVNPYVAASFASVGVSMLIIFSLVNNENTTYEKETSVIEESVESEVEEKAMTDSEQESEPEVLEESTETKGEPETNIVDDATVEQEVTAEQKPSTDNKVEQESTSPVVEPTESQKEESEEEKQAEEEPVAKPDQTEEVEETEVQPGEPVIVPSEPDIIPDEPESVPEEPKVHEHSWIFESYYQNPTCSNSGLVNEICAHCGETQITGGEPTGDHFFEVETVGDCCSAEVVVCTECNFREVREKDPANHIDVEDGFCYGCGHNAE